MVGPQLSITVFYTYNERYFRRHRRVDGVRRRRDPAHFFARHVRDAAFEQGTALITTGYVVDETMTLARMRLGLTAAKSWWELLEGSSRLRWEWIGIERAARARKAFFRHRDKTYSFTDCTSLFVMQELKLNTVLTTDHFQQMGFQVLPRLATKRRQG